MLEFVEVHSLELETNTLLNLSLALVRVGHLDEAAPLHLRLLALGQGESRRLGAPQFLEMKAHHLIGCARMIRRDTHGAALSFRKMLRLAEERPALETFWEVGDARLGLQNLREEGVI